MNRLKIFVTSTFLLATLLGISQNLPWKKTYGGSNFEEALSVSGTTDGGCIVVGESESTDGYVSGNHGDADYWIIKLNASGDTVWEKSLGGSNFDWATSVIQTSDGGYIVAGSSGSNDGDVSGNHGYFDFWIVKLNASGDTVWKKTFGDTLYDVAFSIKQTTDDGYIIAGYLSIDINNADYLIIKLNSSGDLLWQKTFGGSHTEEANSIIQTSDGGFIVAGYSNSSDGDVTGHHDMEDFWILKLDDSGNLQWQRSLGGNSVDVAKSIIQTSDGGYVVAGYSTSSDGDVTGNHGNEDYWVVKLDNSGNIQWQKSLGGSSWDYAYSVIETPDGGFIVAGYSSSTDGDVTGNHGNEDYWIVKLDSNGNFLWDKSFGGSADDLAYSISQSADGGYFIAGRTFSNDGDVTGNHGDYDYWVVKMMYHISSKNSCYGTNNGSATVEWFGNTEPSYQWSNGDTTATADSLAPGWYYVSISNGTETVVDSAYIDEFDSLSIQFFTYDPTCYGLDNGYIGALASGGTPPYSYLWNTGQTTNHLNYLSPGTYTLTVTDTNGCFKIDSTSIAYPEPLQDSIIYTEPSHCSGACNGTATIYVYGGTPPFSFQWSDGETTQSRNLCSNQNYFVTITDSSGCSTTDSITYTVFTDSIQICVVTIDTSTSKCLIVWERPDVQILNGFAVYKETGTNYYEQIGFVNWQEMTEYLDTTSIPAAYAHSYKICMVDTCGNYTPLSYYHKTMYLTANQGANQNEVSLLWTHYEDESGSFQPLTYSIYRKCIPTNPSYELIATIPANITNYNDINPPAGDLYYLVLTPHDNCIPTSIDKAQGGPYNYSVSNIDDYVIQQQINTAHVFVPVSVYPNPVKNKLTVEIYNPQGYTHNIRIVNANGKTVYETNTTSNKLEINRGDLPSGIYNITITGNNKVYNRKIILE